MDWRIYYGDGTTFSSEDGSASSAPPLNVQAIAQALPDDPTVGRKTVSQYDFYWFDGQWFGGDLFGLFDYLMRSGAVKFGRAVPRLEFERHLKRAVTDPDLLPKVAWAPGERQ
jgi:hypothetical protein